MSKVAIIGSQSITDKNYIISRIEEALLENSIGAPVFLCRNKNMVDSYAEYYASCKGIECIPYPNHNNQIIEDADFIIGFWDGSDDNIKNLYALDNSVIYL